MSRSNNYYDRFDAPAVGRRVVTQTSYMLSHSVHAAPSANITLFQKRGNADGPPSGIPLRVLLGPQTTSIYMIDEGEKALFDLRKDGLKNITLVISGPILEGDRCDWIHHYCTVPLHQTRRRDKQTNREDLGRIIAAKVKEIYTKAREARVKRPHPRRTSRCQCQCMSEFEPLDLGLVSVTHVGEDLYQVELVNYKKLLSPSQT